VEEPFLSTSEYMGLMILGRQKYSRDPCAFEVEMAIEKLKRHKSPSIEQIPTELVKASGIELS
jgi:hypothetical protein